VLQVRAFHSRREAQEYIRFQGWSTKFAQVRMFHAPENPLANLRGNVVAIRVNENGSYKWVFNGSTVSAFQYASTHGKPSYGWL
jgi:hypothetical protein